MDGEIDRAKRALRARMAGRRRGSPPVAEADAARASTAIAAAVTALPEFARADGVGLYAALPGEPDLRRVFDALREAGRPGYLPRCRSNGGLDFISISRWEDLEPGRYGVLEPSSRRAFDPSAVIDLVLVPGVAFDRTGRRLGRGSGYYDKALAGEFLREAFRVGVTFECALERVVPAGALDLSMDALVTERGPIRFAGSG